MDTNVQHKLEAVVTFQGKKNCINIGKDTIRLMGAPMYVSLKISVDGTSFAISPCQERDLLSFMVPKDFLTSDQVQFRIHSKQFVDSILSSVGLDLEKTYRVRGRYSSEYNAVKFDLSDFYGIAKEQPLG